MSVEKSWLMSDMMFTLTKWIAPDLAVADAYELISHCRLICSLTHI
jgi:hypothetical protein